MAANTDPPVIVWGRCKGGGRWFWAAQIVGGAHRHGWAANRSEAARRGNAAAVLLSAGRYAHISVNDDVAKDRFAAAEKAKRAKAEAKVKAEREQHAAAGDDVVNLYTIEYGYYDHGTQRWVYSKIVRLPVTKKTPRRIYFLRSSEPGEYETGYIDRQDFEANGWVYTSRYIKISATPPELPNDKPFIPPPFRPEYPRTEYPYRAACTPADLKKLKAEMADAHPDRGGTSETFIAARKRYVDAKRMAGRR